MDWSKLDPNTVTIIAGFLAAGAGWLWHKINGDKVDSFEDTIRGIGKGVIHTLLMDPAVTTAISPDALRLRATMLLWQAASTIGIPRNAATSVIATAVVEHIVGDVLEELRTAAGLQDQLEQLNSQVAAIPAALAKAEADGLAKGRAFAKEMVESVPPDAKPGV
jgi:hypothetical protein